MRSIKKVLALLLAAALTLPIAACDKQPEEPPSATGTDQPSDSAVTTEPGEPDDQPENPAGAESLSIGGVPLADYTIVYASASTAFKRSVQKYDALEHGQEYDFDKVSAQRLQKELKERFGVSLSLAADTTSVNEHEILVGSTARAADDGFDLSRDQYTVSMSEGSLCFLGGAYGTTWHSIDYFLNYLDQSTGDVDLASDFKLEGKHHLTVVGCIGDSITEGVGSSNASMYAYPEALNRILWKDCYVINYGVSGMTMRNDTNAAYMNTSKYSTALRNASGVDVFTIMLGTNDSRGDIVGGYGKNQAKFEQGFSDLLAALHKRGKNARFILMNCPAYYGTDNTFGADYIVEWQGELYEKYKESYDLSFFDMRAFSKANMPSKYFGDLLHPNDAGYVIMAEGVANMLKEYLGLEG